MPEPFNVKAVIVDRLMRLEELDGQRMDSIKADLEAEEAARRAAEQADKENHVFHDPTVLDPTTTMETKGPAPLGDQSRVDTQASEKKAKAKKKSKKRNPVPPLSEYLRYLEAANGHPSRALEHLKAFADLVADFEKVQPPYTDDEIEEGFAPGLEEAQVQEAIVQFMQNT